MRRKACYVSYFIFYFYYFCGCTKPCMKMVRYNFCQSQETLDCILSDTTRLKTVDGTTGSIITKQTLVARQQWSIIWI
jgi:hypothetical protein